jgi:hypothetical protein
MTEIDQQFDATRNLIGKEEIARVALEYWLEADSITKLPHSEPWHLYMLMFQLGYIFCKESYSLND